MTEQPSTKRYSQTYAILSATPYCEFLRSMAQCSGQMAVRQATTNNADATLAHYWAKNAAHYAFKLRAWELVLSALAS